MFKFTQPWQPFNTTSHRASRLEYPLQFAAHVELEVAVPSDAREREDEAERLLHGDEVTEEEDTSADDEERLEMTHDVEGES